MTSMPRLPVPVLRFYYNFSPEVPVTNYAQILINTTDDKTAEEFAHELEKKVTALIPEGSPQSETHATGVAL